MGKRERGKGLEGTVFCTAVLKKKQLYNGTTGLLDMTQCSISIMALFICPGFLAVYFLLSLKSFLCIFRGYQLKCPEIPLQPISSASSKSLPLIDGLLN